MPFGPFRPLFDLLDPFFIPLLSDVSTYFYILRQERFPRARIIQWPNIQDTECVFDKTFPEARRRVDSLFKQYPARFYAGTSRWVFFSSFFPPPPTSATIVFGEHDEPDERGRGIATEMDISLRGRHVESAISIVTGP